MSTVTSYLSLIMGSAEWKAKSDVATIRSNLFLISNLQGAGFDDASEKAIVIPDPDKHPADLTYFAFHFIVSVVAFDACAHDKTLSIKFSLRLSQTLVSLSPSTGLPVAATVDPSTVTHPSSPASTIGFQLGNYTDELLDTLRVDDMCLLIDRACTALSPELPLAVQPSIIFFHFCLY